MRRRDFLRQCCLAAGGAVFVAGLDSLAGLPALGASASVPPGPRPEQLTFAWTVVSNENVLLKPALDQWRHDYGVPYQWIETPNVEPEIQKVLALFVGRQPLDVFEYNWNAMGQFVRQGILLPLDHVQGLSDYLRILPRSVGHALQVGGKTYGLPHVTEAMACSYNERLMEKAGIKAPPATWDEFVDHCVKAKRDRIAEFPALWPAGVGIFIINYVWYSQVASRGGSITDKQGNPTLGPGSIARETLRWWARTFHDWKISDPRSLQLRYYPAAKTYASGQYLYLMDVLPDSFPLINGGDSPTRGQHSIFLQPQGKPLLNVNCGGVAAWSRYPQWAWLLLQYLVGRTRGGLWLGPDGMARLALTGFPAQALTDPSIHKLWAQFFGGARGIDVYLRGLSDSVSVPEIIAVAREAWYPRWTDFVVARLQDCLAGKMTADQACDEISAQLKQLHGMVLRNVATRRSSGCFN